MNTIKREQLFSKHGFPHAALRNLLPLKLAHYDGRPDGVCKTLEDLESAAASGDLMEWQLYRYRYCGTPTQPGKLVRYLFPIVKSRQEQTRAKIEANLGSGI